MWLGADAGVEHHDRVRTKTPAWESAELDFTSHFHARAFSPNLVVTELGPTVSSNFIITGAIPAAGGYISRIAIAVLRTAPETTAAALVEGARHAFEQDQRIWDHLDLSAQTSLDEADAPVLAFRAFCTTFAAHAVTRAPATAPPATLQLTPLPPATGVPSDGRAH